MIRPWGPFAAIAILGCAVLGCSAPIATALDESAANRVVVALEERGILAEKQPDPQAEGRWTVVVSRDESAAALSVLARESLPPPTSPGVLEAMGETSIVPSRAAEHAKMVAGVAGDLERTLMGVDGVLTARVHLAVPVADPLSPSDGTLAPSASVLLRHRGSAPPMAPAEVQRLVAGAVPGLELTRVAVVASSVPDRERAVDHGLARFGPVTATRGSAGWVRGIVAGTVLVGLVLSGLIIALWTRLRRTIEEAPGTSGTDDPR